MPGALLLKSDLKSGRDAAPEEAAQPKRYPEAILFTLCEMLFSGNAENEWISSRDLQERYIEKFSETLEHREEKTNPIDWFSAVLSGNTPAKESEGVFDRWSTIVQRGRPEDARMPDLWYFRIKPEKYDQIKNIYEEVT